MNTYNEDNILMPWYADQSQYDYGEMNGRLLRNDPIPKPKKEVPHNTTQERPVAVRKIVDKHPSLNYDSANTPIMMTYAEMTAMGRMALRGERAFSMRNEISNGTCTPWFERSKQKGLKDLALVCGFMVEGIPEIMNGKRSAVICWYKDGSMTRVTINYDYNTSKFSLSEESIVGVSWEKSSCPDNATEFYEALLDIAQVARYGTPTSYWENYFMTAAKKIYASNEKKSSRVFYLPYPYSKYLSAVVSSRTGAGMGSWQDVPAVGTEEYRITSLELGYQQCKALLYAVNNC